MGIENNWFDYYELGRYMDKVVKGVVFKNCRHDMWPDDIMYLLKGKFL